MWGNRNGLDPWAYVEQRHPDVSVVVMRLRHGLQGCVDIKRGIIWLDERLTPVQARCVLAFEIAKYELGPTPTNPCMVRAMQKAAEEWAALMLVSSDEFVDAWSNCLNLETMASRCNVDVPTFRARIRAASNTDQDRVMDVIADTRLWSA